MGLSLPIVFDLSVQHGESRLYNSGARAALEANHLLVSLQQGVRSRLGLCYKLAYYASIRAYSCEYNDQVLERRLERRHIYRRISGHFDCNPVFWRQGIWRG